MITPSLFILSSFILFHIGLFHMVAFGKTSKPHILFLVLDDVGHADTEVHATYDIPTPKLKDLAKNGIVLGNYYTQTVCSPTRSAIMTGLFPFRFGMQHRTTQLPGMSSHIPLSLPTIPELLSKVGYARHAIGKWHCGYAHWKYTPTGRGFQSHYGYLQGQIDYYNKTFSSDKYGEGVDFWRNKKPLPDAIGKFSVDLYQNEMINVVKNYSSSHSSEDAQSEEPLFLYYAMQSVHIPLESRRNEDRCKNVVDRIRRIYCSMVVEMDDAIGELIDTFKKYKLWDNTVLLLTTDNGGMVNILQDNTGFPEFPASVGSNIPLRGSKFTLFEGGVRSLAMISGGKNFFNTNNKGRRYNGLMHAVDLSAMALKLAGVNYNNIDGIDQWDDILQLKDTNTKRLTVPINMVSKCITFTSIRFDKYKLIIDQDTQNKADGYWPTNGSQPVMPNDHKQTPFYLFDLDEDPNEERNLVETKEQLHEKSNIVMQGIKEIFNYISSGYHEPQSSIIDFDPRSLPQLHNKFLAPYLFHTSDIDLTDQKDAFVATQALSKLVSKWFGSISDIGKDNSGEVTVSIV